MASKVSICAADGPGAARSAGLTDRLVLSRSRASGMCGSANPDGTSRLGRPFRACERDCAENDLGSRELTDHAVSAIEGCAYHSVGAVTNRPDGLKLPRLQR